MAKYIECERIRKAIVGACLTNQNCPMFIAAKIDQMIDCEPAADVAPVVHGRWVYHNFDTICSECRKSAIFDEWEQQAETEFCPNCGAKMDGEETHDR